MGERWKSSFWWSSFQLPKPLASRRRFTILFRTKKRRFMNIGRDSKGFVQAFLTTKSLIKCWCNTCYEVCCSRIEATSMSELQAHSWIKPLVKLKNLLQQWLRRPNSLGLELLSTSSLHKRQVNWKVKFFI